MIDVGLKEHRVAAVERMRCPVDLHRQRALGHREMLFGAERIGGQHAGGDARRQMVIQQFDPRAVIGERVFLLGAAEKFS
ncbi:hypothetical protein [Burkholderia sp. Ac-20379]|uniref:hypothetical protein n=1 Tax=Burkholderia sp. Ac-20379 TaxID=2703900 RepID=UPI001F1210AC|nr:hypothetical protein [Burkholderia sp. Ac-20379]